MSARQYEGTPMAFVYDSEAPDCAARNGVRWRAKRTPYGPRPYHDCWTIYGAYGAVVATTGHVGFNLEGNARLIAAAPDLLEAALPFDITGWLNEGVLKNTRADDLKIKIELEGTTYEPFFVTIGQFRALSAAIARATGAA